MVFTGENKEKMGFKIKLILALFFLSGFCGLVYQVVWSRMLGLVFGNNTYAISTILASFMGGLALGAWMFGRIADKLIAGKKTSSFADMERCSLWIYGLLELGIAFYCAFTPFIFDQMKLIFAGVGTALGDVTGIPLPVQFVFSFLIIIIPTLLMGGTLPILSAYFSNSEKTSKPLDIGNITGLLYSVNTWGAVIGALACGYLLILLLGTGCSVYFAVFVNAVIGLISVFLAFGTKSEKHAAADAKGSFCVGEPDKTQKALPEKILVLTAAGVTGFAGLAYEVLWTRTLNLILGSSTYAFTIMLGAFLAGIALGSFLYTRIKNRLGSNNLASMGIVEALIAVSVLVMIPVFSVMPFLFLNFYSMFSSAFLGFQIMQFGMVFLLLLMPTTLFGLMLPLAVGTYNSAEQQAGMSAAGKSVGDIYSANTIGAIAGSVAAGFMLIPMIGLQNSMLAVGVINAIMAVILLNAGMKKHRFARNVIISGLLFFVIPYTLAMPKWDKHVVTSGVYNYAPEYVQKKNSIIQWKEIMEQKKTIYYKDGVNFTVAVQEYDDGTRALSINGKTDASSNYRGDMVTQVLSGHLPVILHGAQKADGYKEKSRRNLSVLLIGLASGVTLGSVAQWENMQSIDCVEVEPAMVEASEYFNEWNNRPFEDPRVNIIFNDARNYLLTTDKKYDIIISVPSNPYVSGCASFFTSDFYSLAKSRLKDKGIFCGWVQTYKLRLKDYKGILKTAGSQFKSLSLWQASDTDTLIIAGLNENLRFDYEICRDLFSDAEIELASVGIKNANDLLMHFIMGEEGVKNMINECGLEINSDEHPFIEFNSARYFYDPENTGIVLSALFDNAHIPFGYFEGVYNKAELARMYVERGMINSAEASISILEDEGYDAQTHIIRSIILMGKGDAEQALSGINKAIEMDEKSEDAYIIKARIQLMRKDFAGALRSSDKALDIMPDSFYAHNVKGMILQEQEKYQEALEEYAIAASINNEFLPAYLNQAIIYLEFLKVPPAALFILREAVRINPRSSQAYYLMGKTFDLLKDKKSAGRMYSKALYWNEQTK